MKIVTVLGARPQFVKAAVVSRAIAARNRGGADGLIAETIVHTGQHYDDNMSEVFFREMGIPEPAYRLGIAERLHGRMTGRMLMAIEEILLAMRPDAVLVYGDTNSTLAGALAAAKLHIPVAHVEAGLRSFNLRMPEEINRILVDRISQWLFCPTAAAVRCLQREGARAGTIFQCGDVMYDAVLHYRLIAQATPATRTLIDKSSAGYCLATVHRAENTDDSRRLRAIIAALEAIARDEAVIMPLHPRTRRLLDEHGIRPSRLTIVDPVGYFDMLELLARCSLVLTDSGGLQKEAFFLHKPCVTLRDETEWVELVEGGYNVLAGADPARIAKARAGFDGKELAWSAPLYGDGRAGDRIVDILCGSH
jgi:UDP-GlcNAc3NAcA epimerase